MFVQKFSVISRPILALVNKNLLLFFPGARRQYPYRDKDYKDQRLLIFHSKVRQCFSGFMINEQRGECFQISAYKIVAVSLCHGHMQQSSHWCVIEGVLFGYWRNAYLKISNLRLANIKKPLFCNFFTTTVLAAYNFWVNVMKWLFDFFCIYTFDHKEQFFKKPSRIHLQYVVNSIVIRLDYACPCNP